VCLLVGASQSLGRDVRIHLRRGQALVTEQFLDDTEIGATFEQVARK
jgi:hypothetical protein